MLSKIFLDIYWKEFAYIKKWFKALHVLLYMTILAAVGRYCYYLHLKKESWYREIKPVMQTHLLQRGISELCKDRLIGTSSVAHELGKVYETCGKFKKTVIIHRTILKCVHWSIFSWWSFYMIIVLYSSKGTHRTKLLCVKYLLIFTLVKATDSFKWRQSSYREHKKYPTFSNIFNSFNRAVSLGISCYSHRSRLI